MLRNQRQHRFIRWNVTGGSRSASVRKAIQSGGGKGKPDAEFVAGKAWQAQMFGTRDLHCPQPSACGEQGVPDCHCEVSEESQSALSV